MKNKKVDATQRTKVGKELDFASREAYNLLRTNISFAFPDQKGGKVIGITYTKRHNENNAFVDLWCRKE